MSSSKKIFSSAGVVACATLFSRILGFIRDMVIASYMGAGMAADAFFVAFRIPNLFRKLLAEGSLTTAYIPVFTTIMNNKGRKEAALFAENSFRFFSVFLFFLCLLCVAASPYIIRFTAPGFFEVGEKADLAITLTRIMFPYLFFICLVALSMGILNSLEHFAAPAIAPVFLNICMIASVVCFGSFFDSPVKALSYGVVAGGVVQLLFQFPFLFQKGINPFKGISLWHPEIKKVTALMGPTVFGAAVYQISILISTILASVLPQGSVSYLYYSDRLVQFPLALFGITAGIVVLPLMSKQVAANEINEIRKTLAGGLCFIFFITIPSTLGLMVIGKPVIAFLFERGAFTHEMTHATYLALIFYSIGLFAASGVKILVPFFYSFKDAKTPVRAGIISFGSNIVFSFILMHFFSYFGLAMAVSIGSFVNFILLLLKVNSKIDKIDWNLIIIRFFIIVLCSFIMGAGVYLLDMSLNNILPHKSLFLGLRILLDICVGIFLYFFAAVLFKLPEIKTIKGLMRGRS